MLYEAAKKQHPYQPASETEQQLTEQADNLFRQLTEQHSNLHHELWLFRDRMEIIDFYHSQYFFALGLDIGNSLAYELALLTDKTR